MGSSASKSTSAYSVRNYSTILRNGNAFKLGDLDVSKSTSKQQKNNSDG